MTRWMLLVLSVMIRRMNFIFIMMLSFSTAAIACDDQDIWQGKEILSISYESEEQSLVKIVFSYPQRIDSREFAYIIFSSERDGMPASVLSIESELFGDHFRSYARVSKSSFESLVYRISLQYTASEKECGFTHTKVLEHKN